VVEEKAKRLTTEEVCRELQIAPAELTVLRRELDGSLFEKVRHPDYPGVQRLLWSPEAIEKLQSLLEERRRKAARREEMLTSQEVCQLLGIEARELQRVRKFLGSRIRTERRRGLLVWEPEAVELLRRGLGEMAAALARAEDGKLSSLEVCEELGINHQRLMHLRRQAGNELPRARGEGRHLRWERAEVEKLRGLQEEHREREEAREAARHGEIVAALLKCSRDAQDVSERIKRLVRALKDNRTCGAVTIHTLPDRRYALAKPLTVSVFPAGDRVFVASLPEIGLEAEGSTRARAVQSLRRALVQAYLRMRRSPEAETELHALEDLIVENRER